MTIETLTDLLSARGFVDVRHEHRWNDFQMERDFPTKGILIVWSRNWPHISIQWSQDYEATVSAFHTTEGDLSIDDAIKTVDATIEYINVLESLVPVKA